MGLISRVSSRTYSFQITFFKMPDKKQKKPVANTENKEEAEEEPVAFDRWDNRQVKNAIDDTVKEVVKKQLGESSEECFALVDKRLGWLFSAACFVDLLVCMII